MSEYRIETVGDFLKVPERRRAHCLLEFLIWLSLADECGSKHKPLSFDWIDDGHNQATVNFVTEIPPTNGDRE